MIKIVANNYIRADALDEYLALNREIVEKTNANDKGCISYALHQDVNDPLHFAMLEEWEDQASIDAHMKSKHFTEIIPKVVATSDPAKEGAITFFKKLF
ncbi:MAG: antibiotic biosynthesis monooxygenase [Oscillospiraceae bacterium]|jgi:quinol monooxygenase YgiN|nr:antibiotic biosynthesis monooxygenase [Oscillospiraceae bacterium]